jgi:hypothetical protein
MTNEDRPMFTEALTTVADGFRVPVTEGILKAYWLALEDLPLEAIQRACLKTLRLEDRFPVPLTIRQYTRKNRVVL